METVDSLLSYDERIKLGRGSYSCVYLGILNNNNGSSKSVAVKRIENTEPGVSFIQREVELMLRTSDHPNILRYICTKNDDDFVYIVTELCKGTLEDYVKGKYQGPKFQNEKEIIFQVTQGLAHLHSKNIVHRDIKPNNILIFVPDGHGAKPLMKLADFGISKCLNTGREDFTNTSVTNPNGTRGWMAPEVYQLKRFDCKVDIFPLGCIFAYTLSGGKHPYGDDPDKRIVRMKEKQPMLMVQQDLIKLNSGDREAFGLIKVMLEMDPSKRPTTGNILDSVIFKLCSVEGRTQQLVDICLSLRVGIKSKYEYDCAYQQLEFLFKHGKVNANTRTDNSGWTPLHILCEYYKNDNLFELVKLLIENEADVKAKNDFGWTPLHFISGQHENDNLIDVVKLLIQNGADVNAKEYHGQTPLHLLCAYYKNENLIDLVKFLKQKGADLNAKDKSGRIPLHSLYIYYKNDNLIDRFKYLMQNVADVEMSTSRK